MIDWLVGWLVGWLVVCDCLFAYLFAFLLSCLGLFLNVSARICSQGHTTSTEPEGETPAVDLDLETVTDSVKDHGCHGCLAESWSERTRTE